MAANWWVYMVETESGRLYTGITTDVARRFCEHSNTSASSKGAKFFRSDPASKVVYRELSESRSAASRREAAIKKLSRKEKLLLLASASGSS